MYCERGKRLCGTVMHRAVLCYAMRCDAKQCDAILCDTKHCNAGLMYCDVASHDGVGCGEV